MNLVDDIKEFAKQKFEEYYQNIELHHENYKSTAEDHFNKIMELRSECNRLLNELRINGYDIQYHYLDKNSKLVKNDNLFKMDSNFCINTGINLQEIAEEVKNNLNKNKEVENNDE